MPRKWSAEEKKKHTLLLKKLYIKENKSINEIGKLLCISEKTVFKRLKHLNIKTNKKGKINYANQRNDIYIPKKQSSNLAECFGVLLGDGNISRFQIIVTLGKTETDYVSHIVDLFNSVFNAKPKISIRANGHFSIYLNSARLSRWFQKEGFVFNKVKSQVAVPVWIFTKPSYMKSFLRGFFDTDGSVYKLKFGIQMSFTNKSIPLLIALQKALFELQYKPSEISSWKIYLTRKEDIKRFFTEIKPKNKKHLNRFQNFK